MARRESAIRVAVSLLGRSGLARTLVGSVCVMAVVVCESIDGVLLLRWLAVRNQVRPHEALSPANMRDWRGQSQDMTWLLASVDGRPVGCGLGIIGWHSPPGGRCCGG